MKSLLATPLSSERFWGFLYFALGIYLLFHPALFQERSYAVALGGGLALLLFRAVPPGSLALLGPAWWLFLLYALLSAPFSLVPALSLQSAGFLFLGTLLYLMGRSQDPASQTRVEVLFLLAAAACAWVALGQWYHGFENLAFRLPGLSGEELKIATAAAHNKRAFGPLVTPGALAALLIFFLPQGFLLALTASGGKRVLFGLLTLLLAAGLGATQSVGAVACLTLSVLALLWLRRRMLWVGAALGLGLLGVGAVLATRGLQSWLWAALHMRLALWQSAWSIFTDHPLFGTGWGTFAEAYQRGGFSLETGSRFAHNLFLQLLAETGLVGLSLFLLAAFQIARRLKPPSRWEGWGVLAGALAFFLFAFVDLPFQMPELVWIFAGLLGRLELSPPKPLSLPSIPLKWVEGALLALLLAAGFLPPFSPEGYCLLAAVLWGLLALFQQKPGDVPWTAGAGALFIVLRAFNSPSALGATRFLEISGFALAFYLILPCLPKPERFFKGFLGLGLVWALKPWWISLRDGSQSLSQWLDFQYSDVQGFLLFQNPKHVGIFLLPLVFFMFGKARPAPRGGSGKGRMEKILGVLAAVFALLTILRLKAMAAVVGLGAGCLVRARGRARFWTGAALLFLALGLGWLRLQDSSSTSLGRIGIWESAVKVWAMDPLFGVGPGAFDGDYHLVKIPRASGVNRYLMDAQVAHNEFLELLVAFGLVGFGFGGWVLWKVWKGAGVRRPALAGLGAASLFDFCFHNPMIALEGAGLAAVSKPRKTALSWGGALLAAGLSVGLFGSALGARALEGRYEAQVAQGRFPEALRCLEYAERVNAWDGRVTLQRADYLERLYLATKDPAWAGEADEAYARALDLEKSDGQLRFKDAERLTRRLSLGPLPALVEAADRAWREARRAMPFNALIRYEEGLFRISLKDGDGALADFQKAVELEPYYAAAWANLGFLLRKKGRKAEARSDFQRALEVYGQWKDARRIAPLERQLVDLTPATVKLLRQEVAR